jgi:O-antigen ligase
MWLLHPSRRWRAAAGILLAVLAAGIVLTFSKGAWVTACAGLGVVSLHAIVRGWRPAPRARLAAVAVIAIAMLLPPVRAVPVMMFERWTSYGSELSNRERLRYIDVATTLIVDKPLLGVGLERFGDAFKEHTGARVGPDDPHNAYMMVAAELGVPALGTYVLMAAAVAAAAWRRGRSASRETAAVRVGLSAAVCALLVFQVFSAEPLASRLTWIVFGLALTGEDGPART